MPRLCLSLLGPIQVTLDDKTLTSSLLVKHLALLAYLTIEADRPHRREALAGLFWPEQSEAAARHSLREAFHQLRKAFGEITHNFLTITPQSAQFTPFRDFSLDVEIFSAEINQFNYHSHRRIETCKPCIRNLQHATSLYRGEFLEDLFLKDSCRFEEWALVQRDRFARIAISAYHYLVEYYQLCGEYSLMEQAARRQIEINPFYERAHRRVMQALAWRGDRTAAMAHYESFMQMLAKELDVSPETQTSILQTQIRDGALTPHHRAPLHNWHEPLTSFIGRQNEIDQISQYLQDPEVRLVTLVGPGGIGKTRLALEAVSQEAYSFRDGACFVPLASVSLPEDVVSSIANSLDVFLTGSIEPITQLKSHLHKREMILLLDNLEHLTLARNQIHELLQGCLSLKIIVTSRESLNLQEEWLIPVQGLSSPDEGNLVNLKEFDSVKLFLQRASQIRPEFVLQDRDRPAVIKICQSVDGMPLALELAASWIKVLSCHEIANDINWEFLTTGAPGLPERHRSLQLVLDHSWRMLSSYQQQALMYITVFSGGFTRKAAEKVTGVDLSVLSELVSKSLLKLSSEMRFDLHPLIQQYAAEKLTRNPEEKLFIEDRHGHYYTEITRQLGERLKGPDQMEALSEFDLEIDNIRKAWQWAISGIHLTQIEQCREGLGFYYRTKGNYHEGEKAFEQAVTVIRNCGAELFQSNPRLTDLLGSILVGQGICCLHQGQPLQAYQLLFEGLGLLRATGSAKELAFALAWLGVVTIFFGEYQQAAAFTQEGLAYARRSNDVWTIGMVLLCVGHAIRPIDCNEASKCYYESVEKFRVAGDRRTLATSLYFYGEMIRHTGNHVEAKYFLEESLELAKETRSSSMEARSMGSLAELAYSAGNYLIAREMLESSLEILSLIGERRVILSGLACLGAVKYRLVDPVGANEYFKEAIKKGLEMHATPLVLGCLIHMAEAINEENGLKRRLATEILGFVLHHSDTWQEDRVRAERLLTKLSGEMSISDYESSIQSGSTATIATLAGKVSELLSLTVCS